MRFDFFSGCVRPPALCLLMGLVAMLSACGGGGDSGDSDLMVDFRWGVNSFSLMDYNEYAPVISGLQGKTPICALTGGSVPPGMSLVSAGCRVVGTPTAVGSWGGTMVLTVDGYKGSLSAPASFNVSAPNLVGFFGSPTVAWRQTFRFDPIVALTGFTQRLGDQVIYSLQTPLPDGVVFDASTLTLSGATEVSPSFDLSLRATITRGSWNYTTNVVIVRVAVTPELFQYENHDQHNPCCHLAWLMPFRAAPNAPTANVPVAYAVDAAHSLPPGLTLNAATGVISGIPADFDPENPRYKDAQILRTQTGEGGHTIVSAVTLRPTIRKPEVYVHIGNDLHVRTIQRTGLGTTLFYYGEPGDQVTFIGLASLDPLRDPVPSWMTLNYPVIGGEVAVAPPANATGRYDNYVLRYTILRNGVSLNGQQNLRFTVITGT
ncbi:MAG: hypothetical protein H7Y33_01965 [Cytophagales bacterium]|nr:hypothetical protein [Rhizobacter sp.]